MSLIWVLAFGVFFWSNVDAVSLEKYPELTELAAELDGNLGLRKEKIESWFEGAEIKTKIIDAMNRPAERLDWHRYRSLFVNTASIEGGVKFLKENAAVLGEAEARYGIPAEIIVAIIGVETRYGKVLGNLRVLDSLVTLSVEYPRRSKFFSSQLAHFLKLTAEEGLDPTVVKGSYAGAMGIPQFMPSSYRDYAIDFDGDGRADLLNSVADAIGSVANYLSRFGWKAKTPIMVRISQPPSEIENLVTRKLTANTPISEVRELEIEILGPDDGKVGVMKFDGKLGPDYRIGHHNFFVITRYNRSQNYAMSVYELAEKIAAASSN